MSKDIKALKTFTRELRKKAGEQVHLPAERQYKFRHLPNLSFIVIHTEESENPHRDYVVVGVVKNGELVGENLNQNEAAYGNETDAVEDFVQLNNKALVEIDQRQRD